MKLEKLGDDLWDLCQEQLKIRKKIKRIDNKIRKEGYIFAIIPGVNAYKLVPIDEWENWCLRNE
jgi:hypothetical protein